MTTPERIYEFLEGSFSKLRKRKDETIIVEMAFPTDIYNYTTYTMDSITYISISRKEVL